MGGLGGGGEVGGIDSVQSQTAAVGANRILFHQSKVTSRARRAPVDNLGIGATARRLLALLSHGWPFTAAVLWQQRVGLRGTAVENSKGAIDTDLEVASPLACRVVGVSSGDAHHDLSSS